MKVTALRVGDKSLTFGWHPGLYSFFLHLSEGNSLFGIEDPSTTRVFGNRQGEIPTYAAFEKLLLSHVPLTESLRLAIEPLKTDAAQSASAGNP